MTTPHDKATLDLILDAIDSPRALVILVDDDGQISSGAKNLSDLDVLNLCTSIGQQVREQLGLNLPTNGRQVRRLYLPPGVN